MKLTYYDEELNFGDALNKLIFEHYIPELLDDNEDELLLGIGTVLGLIKGEPNTKRIVVFSSGLGSGTDPKPDHRYDFVCVRGPYTAQKLGLDPKLGITDGAVLLRGMPFEKPSKKYKWSYIPHRGSEVLFHHWKEIVEKAGGHYISPINKPEFVINEILKSEIIVAEAMHGAIVSDVLRVPWIPVSGYKHINNFKWNDWLSTMEMKYQPVLLPPVFHKEKITENFAARLKTSASNPLAKVISAAYHSYQKKIRETKIINVFRNIESHNTFLSDEKILEQKYNQLLQKITQLKEKYHSQK